MTDYVERIEANFIPKLGNTYEPVTIEVDNFFFTIEGGKLIAITKKNMDTDKALRRLHEQIVPFLAAISAQESKRVWIAVTDIKYPTKATGIRDIPMRIALSRLIPSKYMEQVITSAIKDHIYQDLLDLYSEAQASENPRPAGFKVWDRLKVKFGYRVKISQKDEAVLSALPGLDRGQVALLGILAPDPGKNQSQFRGDRHAALDKGKHPERLEEPERSKILAAILHIIHEYEIHEGLPSFQHNPAP